MWQTVKKERITGDISRLKIIVKKSSILLYSAMGYLYYLPEIPRCEGGEFCDVFLSCSVC